MKEVENVAIF